MTWRVCFDTNSKWLCDDYVQASSAEEAIIMAKFGQMYKWAVEHCDGEKIDIFASKFGV